MAIKCYNDTAYHAPFIANNGILTGELMSKLQVVGTALLILIEFFQI